MNAQQEHPLEDIKSNNEFDEYIAEILKKRLGELGNPNMSNSEYEDLVRQVKERINPNMILTAQKWSDSR